MNVKESPINLQTCLNIVMTKFRPGFGENYPNWWLLQYVYSTAPERFQVVGGLETDTKRQEFFRVNVIIPYHTFQLRLFGVRQSEKFLVYRVEQHSGPSCTVLCSQDLSFITK